jgi:hypothetical protein
MSLPIAAVGPLKVETKPILIVSPRRGLRQRQKRRACQPECLFHNHSPPRYRTRPRVDRRQRLSARPHYQVRYFVREIAGQRQA